MTQKTTAYTLLPVNDPAQVSELLVSKLGLTIVHRNFDGGTYSGVLLRDNMGHSYLAVDCNAHTLTSNALIIETADCIKDCYFLTGSGLQICTHPYYTNEGLIAEFYDSSGNKFMLIEKRKIKIL